VLSRHLCLALLCLVAAGCARKPPAISVVRQGSDYLFRFAPCGPDPARIMDLALSEVGADQPTCSLVLTHDPRQTITGEWKYGQVPPAYKKKRCDPLLPAHRYRLEVTHATLDFELNATGAPTTLSTACR
jgi:hypothetical protein